ncbi:MAG: HAD family hydrolase [Spirochaetes bacterium]|nr:HAD family hydrolase [Spirochaetota bacterium]
MERSRHDFGNFNRLPDEDARRLLTLLEGRIGEFQAVAVNEQVPEGLHTPCFRAGLARLMEEHPQTLFLVDSRHHSDAYPSAWLKLNDSEALRLCGMGEEGGLGRERVLAAARSLFRKRARPVFITRGARGILLWDARGPREIPGLRPEGAIDTVGAGDSALAGIAAGLACGASADEAAWLGNLCAAVTIRKLRQTGTATPREILESARTAVPERQIDLADAPQRARFLPGTDFEVAEELPPDFRPTHAIFDHDGTISTLREGWEGVMEPMMIRAILGPDAEKAEPGLFRRVQERTREFIDRSTGIQTLAQMRGLVDLVREFGRVPEGEILDMHGYKEIYNRALMERVDERRSRLERGEFSPEDFTLKNAISFLEWLHRRGVRLYLASGTDEADVKREASALGYDRLFEGRIYGASGDVAHEAKRQVLERLLGELGPEALRGVVTFGDGPVELRETRRLGGQAIGLCSDEKRRYGINPEKRSRLVRAGAQILIPDYSRLDALTALLHL